MKFNKRTLQKIIIFESKINRFGSVATGVAAGAVVADAYHKGGSYGNGGTHITDTIVNAGKRIVDSGKELLSESTLK